MVEALAAGHRRRGHDVMVATILFGNEEHPVVGALRSSDVPVHEIRLSPRDYLGERRAIRSLCRSFQPHVVHTHGVRVDVVDRGVAASLGIPTVTTVHGPSMVGGLKGAFYEWIQRTNYRRFDAVVAVSAALRDTTLADGVKQRRLHLIPNAFGGLRKPLPRADARRRLDLDANATVIGWVGRLIPVKGGDIFLDALHRLPSPRPVVAMIGHGREAEALAQQAKELGLESVVHFYPDVTDADRLFSAFDALVLSSRSEGMPLVLLEGMATKVPIVATRVGGVPEAIGNEEALLVPPEDPTALANAIQDVLHNPQAARLRALKAETRLSTAFSFARWLDCYEEVYRTVLERAPASNSQPRFVVTTMADHHSHRA